MHNKGDLSFVSVTNFPKEEERRETVSRPASLPAISSFCNALTCKLAFIADVVPNTNCRIFLRASSYKWSLKTHVHRCDWTVVEPTVDVLELQLLFHVRRVATETLDLGRGSEGRGRAVLVRLDGCWCMADLFVTVSGTYGMI